MKPEDLHHRHLTALITGDLEGAAKLRTQFRAQDHELAADLLSAATAACLEYRFGPGAGLGAGPIDFDRLRTFMNELRDARRIVVTPPDYLAIEAVVRGHYSEPHLTEPLSDQRRSQAHYAVLACEGGRHRWLRANAAHLVDRAKARMTTWILS